MDARMARGIEGNYVEERSSEALYLALARIDDHPDRGKVLERLATLEHEHAEIWAGLLKGAGVPLPHPRHFFKHRIFGGLARTFGVGVVLAAVHKEEADGIAKYLSQMREWTDPKVQEAFLRILPDEVSHEMDTLDEARHAAEEGGSLRSAVLGANDGLGSMLALTAGVAAATASDLAVLIAGSAALVAGAVSMAASNYVSVKAEQEVYAGVRHREVQGISVDRPAKEALLRRAYEKRGFTPEEAERLVARLSGKEEEFTRALLAERHGIAESSFEDPVRLGAITGGAFFAAGLVPLLPFFFIGGTPAVLLAVAASGIALFFSGVFRSLSTLSSLLRGGLEMLAVGLGSAGLTYAIGLVIGGFLH